MGYGRERGRLVSGQEDCASWGHWRDIVQGAFWPCAWQLPCSWSLLHRSFKYNTRTLSTEHPGGQCVVQESAPGVSGSRKDVR
jgi:hypothetical protein